MPAPRAPAPLLILIPYRAMDRMFYIAFSMVTGQTSFHYQKPLECYCIAEPLICAWTIKDKNRLLPPCFIASSSWFNRSWILTTLCPKTCKCYCKGQEKGLDPGHWIQERRFGCCPTSLKLVSPGTRNCVQSLCLFFIKVISLKRFISHVTHLRVPRTPEAPGICFLLFSFLSLLKVTSSVGRQMGLVLHKT